MHGIRLDKVRKLIILKIVNLRVLICVINYIYRDTNILKANKVVLLIGYLAFCMNLSELFTPALLTRKYQEG